MKRFLPILLLAITPACYADLSHSITASTKLTVGGASTTSTRLGNSYSISGSGVDTSYTTAAGTTVSDGLGSLNVTSGVAEAPAITVTQKTAGNSFTFSQSFNQADAIPTAAVTVGANPNFSDKYVGTDYSNPRWYNFGAGANDGTSQANLTGSAFTLKYEGVNYIPTVTMFAHAPVGELNNSTNPTFIAKHQKASRFPTTGSNFYSEDPNLEIKQLHHSKHENTGSAFQKQTYISKIGIYDKDKKLIAVAKLSNPIRKTEERDITFKMKLDF